MSKKIKIDKKSILITGEIKERDINKISIDKNGNMKLYEIIETDDKGPTLDKNNVICEEFIEIE